MNPFDSANICLDVYCHYFFDKGYVFKGHRHRNFELNIILEGEMEIACEENIYKIGKGEFILIPSTLFHKNNAISNTTTEMFVVGAFTDTNISLTPRKGKLNEKTMSLFKLFCNDIEETAVLDSEGCVLEFQGTSKKLLEVMLEYLIKDDQIADEDYDEKELIYYNAVKLMNERVCDNLSVSDISKHCGVCKTTIKNIFSHYTGMGCIEFFGDIKLEAARKLLRDGNSCAEVSEKLGFSSQAYFSRKFKKHYGYSPSKIYID